MIKIGAVQSGGARRTCRTWCRRREGDIAAGKLHPFTGPDQGQRRQGAARRGQGDQRRRAVEDGLLRRRRAGQAAGVEVTAGRARARRPRPQRRTPGASTGKPSARHARYELELGQHRRAFVGHRRADAVEASAEAPLQRAHGLPLEPIRRERGGLSLADRLVQEAPAARSSWHSCTRGSSGRVAWRRSRARARRPGPRGPSTRTWTGRPRDCAATKAVSATRSSLPRASGGSGCRACGTRRCDPRGRSRGRHRRSTPASAPRRPSSRRRRGIGCRPGRCR